MSDKIKQEVEKKVKEFETVFRCVAVDGDEDMTEEYRENWLRAALTEISQLSKGDSLLELIKKCGEIKKGVPFFKQLNYHSKRNRPPFLLATWSAKARRNYKKGEENHITTWGETPEEAVEKLLQTLTAKQDE